MTEALRVRATTLFSPTVLTIAECAATKIRTAAVWQFAAIGLCQSTITKAAHNDFLLQ